MDCQYNYNYVLFLARNGFNVVLTVDNEHIRKCKEYALRIGPLLKVEVINIDWVKEEANL
jgi:hypothetical protein